MKSLGLAAVGVVLMFTGCFAPASMQVAPANLVTGRDVQAKGAHVETSTRGMSVFTIPIREADVLGAIQEASQGRPITNLQVNYWNWLFPIYFIFGWDYADIEFDYVQ